LLDRPKTARLSKQSLNLGVNTKNITIEKDMVFCTFMISPFIIENVPAGPARLLGLASALG
jgi:hypothetical protein